MRIPNLWLLAARGYQVSRVQRVDIGLTQSGFATDKYRVVFYGRAQEVHELGARYPALIPYLPLKIAIFAEGEETLLVASNPARLADFYPQAELAAIFNAWEHDLRAIFAAVRAAQ